MTKNQIIIATRESPLAMRQAELIKALISAHRPELTINFLGITTKADKMLEVTLSEVGGKGLFVKELEEALLDGRADIAVHSMKDVPMELPAGLCLPVMSQREDPRDAFISNHYATFDVLPAHARIGTASLRRQTQLCALRADLDLQTLRGNINTRLRRLDEGDFDAIILAGAGLTRMGFFPRIRHYFSPQQMLPAAGQGVLGIECRSDDKEILKLIAPLNDELTYTCVSAERAVCRGLEGGCKVPVAAYAEMQQDHLYLRALVANRDGQRILRAECHGHYTSAETMGKRLAEELLQQGAAQILQEFIIPT